MEGPVCVEVCPTQALELVDLEEIEKLLHKRREETIKTITSKKREGLVLLGLGREKGVR
jgi:Fe-S-cluster-containing hydrogenase component 2